MKSLISTIAIATSLLTQTAFSAEQQETPTVHTDAYTIVSTMAKSDINEFIKFTNLLNGTMINMIQWDSIDKSYKLSKPRYSVVTSKFYNHDNTVCTDIAVSVEQGGTIGTGTGTMCKSGDSWIILEE